MLSIKYQPLGSGVKSIDWYVDEKNPISYHDCANVLELQADGDELSHIRDIMPKDQRGNSLLIPKGRVVRIFGDLAKTIVANLTNK